MSRFDLTPTDPEGDAGRLPYAPIPSQAGYMDTDLEETVDLRDVLGVLRRNVLLIASVAVVALAITAFVVLRQVPQYQAIGVIRIADARQAMTGGLGNDAMEQVMGRSADPLLSQLEVLKGRRVLGDVVDREGLRLVPATTAFSHFLLGDVRVTGAEATGDTLHLGFSDSTVITRLGSATSRAAYGAPTDIGAIHFVLRERPSVDEAELVVISRDEAIDRLATELVAQPRDKTDAVEIRYTAPDPRFAQVVVNAAIDAFQLNSASGSQQQSRRRRIFLEQQLHELDSTLVDMQFALSSFRSRNQVYSSAEKISAQQQGLMGLDVEREQLVADRGMFASLLAGLTRARGNREQILRTLASSPGIASNPVIAQLYHQLIDYQSSRDSLTTGTLGATAAHPDVQRLDGMIESTQTRLVDAARSHVAALDARIAAMNKLRDRNAGEIELLPSTEAEEVRLVQQVATTQKMGDQLREELQRARISEAVEAGGVEVVNTAPLPREPIGRGRGLKLALGLVLGLMLGAGGAFVREHLNTSIRRREDVEEILRVPGLAVIPRMAFPKSATTIHVPALGPAGLNGHPKGTGDSDVVIKAGNELITAYDLKSSGAEAFRMLRTNLLFSHAAEAIKTLVVTSSTPGEGKTTTAANLAASFAQQGMRVLIVDCDMRRARLHRLFNTPTSPGLSELLLGTTLPADAIRETQVEGLFVLPAGVLPPNPAELLGGERMRKALAALSHGYDMVILDTPPLMAAADAAILGARVDGVLMVVRAGQTDRGVAQYALQQLQGVGARVVGAVLNDPDAQVPLYGGYYYYSYYGDDARKKGRKAAGRA